jgi:predicted helicase
LQQFRTHYGDKKIRKWDIFYYVFGLLHHPGYRTKFADNLKRELPRTPFAPRDVPSPVPLQRKKPRVARPESSKGVVEPSTPFEDSGRATQPASGRVTQSGFWAFAKAGKELATLHLDYEKLKP